jgi:hypothetical protein
MQLKKVLLPNVSMTALPSFMRRKCCTSHERQVSESCIAAPNDDTKVGCGPEAASAAPCTFWH